MASSASGVSGKSHRPEYGWLSIASLFIVLDAIVWVLFAAGSDWAPLWAAGRVSLSDPTRIYDFDLITGMQASFTGSDEFRPYIYPPSALLLVAPIALLPFWISFGLVAGGSAAWLAATAKRVGCDPLLLLLAPPVMIAAIVGQVSLFVVGLVVMACAELGKRERMAGVLFAAAALIKPTLLVLAPIGLVAGRHWTALATAAMTGLAGFAASAMLFGLWPWFDWLAALPNFQQTLVGFEPLLRNTVSPYGFAVHHGFAHWSIIATAAVVAIGFVWTGFVQDINAGTRSALIMGGALLVTPYAMNYELAVFAPALMTLARKDMPSLFVCGLWASSLFFNAGVVGLILAYGAIATNVIRPRNQASATSFA